MKIENNEELKMFIQSELDRIKSQIKSGIYHEALEYNQFLRFEIETRLYNALEDYLRERKYVTQNNWMLITNAIRGGLATYDGYDYNRSNELKNQHLQIKSWDFFENIEKEVLGTIDNIGMLCLNTIVPSATPQDITTSIKDIYHEITSADALKSQNKGINYESNFRQFIESIKLEFRGKLDSNTLNDIKIKAELFRKTIEKRSVTTKNAMLEIFKANLLQFLNDIVDAKMTAGYGENKIGADKYKNL